MAEHSWQEIHNHSTAESLWIVIDNKVYDVTEFQKTHPGSARPFLHFGGKDATEGFAKITKHSNKEGMVDLMLGMCIGTVSS